MDGSASITLTQSEQDPVIRAVVRLLVEPDRRPGWFIARLESSAAIFNRSRQPLVDGARALLQRGFEPATLLTMRHAGKGYDSFKRAPIGQPAKWTYREGEKQALQRRRWMPFAGSAGAQKSTMADDAEISWLITELIDQNAAIDNEVEELRRQLTEAEFTDLIEQQAPSDGRAS